MSRAQNGISSPTIYFHSPCFDGIASAVLLYDFLASKRGWRNIDLVAVNYDIRNTWLQKNLSRPAAVVDFLYHPLADFWFDHHRTTFLTQDTREDYLRRRGPERVFDERAVSNTRLLWNHLRTAFDYRNQRYGALARWADITDGAKYRDVKQALESSAPALRINGSLAFGDHSYAISLVRYLLTYSIEETSHLPVVRERYRRYRTASRVGLHRLRKTIELRPGGIAVFDIDLSDDGTIISRYAPFYIFPDARYSAGVVHTEHGAKLTVMRNPWMSSPNVKLGELCARYGGGGHSRVGSILIPVDEATSAGVFREQIVDEIRRSDPEQ